MAWMMDSCEVEVTGLNGESEQNFYNVQDLCIKEIPDVVFYGRIKDGGSKGLEGALLKIFALRNDGVEIPLNHFYSGKDGYYLVNIPRPEFEVVKYIIRTSKSNLFQTGGQDRARYHKFSARAQAPFESGNSLEVCGE